ncbi:MAG: DUF1553 domain-containing protein, partial [Planctomycetales bacterium]|nr:DUF1553 domain-containing protein [Planctomycetales bacterium]
QIAILTKWVKMGAPWPGSQPTVVAKSDKPTFTDEERAYWAFQPVRPVEPPALENDAWCRNDVDRFVLAKLRENNLEPAAEASRVSLVRRAYFDLIGLPPTPDEVAEFLRDSRDDAYERMIDRLLESPRYGEKWARHWLDLVRYAESDGFKQDGYRPHAWRYRDYVIQSFNDDKPYDQFVMEQLAGDEIMPGDPTGLIANSYLRHWIYEYNQRDVRTQWSNILNDITDVTADAFLGLGMQCARCHNHKFDPILQVDYFRLQAFFTPLRPRDDMFLLETDERAEYDRKMAEWEAATAEIRAKMAVYEAPFRERAANNAIDKFPKDIRPMIRKLADQREPLEQQLAELAGRQIDEELNKLNVASKLKDEAKAEYEALQKQLAEFDKLKPKTPTPAFTVTDVGCQAPPTLIPGKRNMDPIEPGFLTLLQADTPEIAPLESLNSTGRRTELARWIASRENPLTSRVIVNRIWQFHFGQGIVPSASDFGRLGEAPSHPELLDWLANWFMDHDWRFKDLHRLLMNSAAYRQAATGSPPDAAKLLDPQNRLLWRMHVHRLDAEQIRDTMLAVSGELDLSMGGPSVDSSKPRRSIYTKILRNDRDPLLDVFDVVDGFSSVSQRNVTTTPTQSLLMINGPWTSARARTFADRLHKQSGGDPATFVSLAYQTCFGREPHSLEQEAALAFIDEQAARLNEQREAKSPLVEQMPKRDGQAALVQPGTHQDRLRMRGITQLPEKDFTIEAFVMLRSVYEDASVRTLASRWDGNNAHAGWSLGVTSQKSAYRPLNVVFQFVGRTVGGETKYEVVPSNIHLELNRPYYIAASVKLEATGPEGVTFHVQDLSGGAPAQVAQAAHTVVSFAGTDFPFIIGGRHDLQRHTWDGLIDDVRLSNAALEAEQLLTAVAGPRPDTVGFWRFEPEPGFEFDASNNGNQIEVPGGEDRDTRRQAMIDFCHVLLNSNELLYVD